jgi:hypothetical protein
MIRRLKYEWLETFGDCRRRMQIEEMQWAERLRRKAERMTNFVDFIDIIGSNANRAPLVHGGIRAYYITGTDGIEETAAQVAAARAAGMGVVLIDQTPSLSVFAAGLAQIADIEAYAGTATAAHKAVATRQAHGEPSGLYVSLDSQAALKAAISSPVGVGYWVADYSWSVTEAEDQLEVHPDWNAIQYGDPESNPASLVPGTSVTLRYAEADIDVAKATWANGFLPGAPKPAPNPAPTPGLPVYADGSRVLEYLVGKPAATWMRGTDVLALQKFLGSLGSDGIYGPLTAERVSWYEGIRGIPQEKPYGIAGPEVWKNTGLK